MKEGITILQISQKEARYLESKGLKFGTNSEGDIHRSYSGHHKYWCTESDRVKKLLFEYRKDCIVKTVK